MTAILHDTAMIQKAQDMIYPAHGFLCVKFVGVRGIQRKRIGFPHLPVVIECRTVIRTRFAQHDIRQPKCFRQLNIMIAQVHNPYMGNDFTHHIKAGHLYPVLIALDLFKHAGCNALCGFAQMIARKHAVDIGIIGRPETFANVHRCVIYRWNHQNFFAFGNGAFGLQFFQGFYQTSTHIHLLYFVSAQSTYHTSRFFTLPKIKAVHFQAVSIWGLQFIQNFFSHATAPPRIRAISEPSFTTGYSRNVKIIPSQGAAMRCSTSPVSGLTITPT